MKINEDKTQSEENAHGVKVLQVLLVRAGENVDKDSDQNLEIVSARRRVLGQVGEHLCASEGWARRDEKIRDKREREREIDRGRDRER